MIGYIRSILTTEIFMRRTLFDLRPGQGGCIYGIDGDSSLKRRLIDMGIIPGTNITVSRIAPLGDPIEVRLRGYSLSLRKADACGIQLMDDDEARNYRNKLELINSEREKRAKELLAESEHDGASDEAEHERAANLTEWMMQSDCACESGRKKRRGKRACAAEASTDDRPVKLALIGNPNCGKTTLFNAMTGSREYVGNWPGVTVEKKEGRIRTSARRNGRCPDGLCTMGHEMTLVDLPGIYSLSPNSMEEIVSRNFIIDEKPDAIINIIDATNLERNLYLTIQLLELEIPMIIALNMMDEVKRSGDTIDCKALSKELGIPIVPISARTGAGVNDLIEYAQKLIHAVHTQLHEGFKIEPDDLYDDYTHSFHHRIGEIVEGYANKAGLKTHWAEIKLLEGDKLVRDALKLDEKASRAVDAIVAEYASKSPLGDNETLVAESRYRYIEHAVSISLKKKRAAADKTVSDRIDRVLANKYLAIPLFILIMLAIFSVTFMTLGAWLSDLVGTFIESAVSPFITEALISANAQEWFISLVVEGIISGVGGVLTFLPQIALLFFFLSLLEDSGYMSRIAFIMDRPMRRFGLSGKSFIPLLMGFGCTVPATMGARTMENERDKRMTIMLLPFMSCSAKLPVYSLIAGAFFGRNAGFVIVGLYAFGILFGILSGLLFKRTVFKGADAGFLIELPPYRVPSMRNTLLNVWEKVKHFLEKAGTIIFAMSVVIWFLTNFDFSLTMAASQENSILGKIGSFIAPIFTLQGFGVWQAAVALMSGIIAKEAVVSSLSVFYGFAADASNASVFAALNETFTPAAALSFLTFVLLYTPCVAAVSTMRRELGSRKWTVFTVAYQILAAWVASLLVYTVARLF